MSLALIIYWSVAAVLLFLVSPFISHLIVWGNFSGDMNKNLTALAAILMIVLACVFWFPVLVGYAVMQPSTRQLDRLRKEEELRNGG